MSDSEDEIPQLPSDTLAILNSFYSEQAEWEEKMKKITQDGSSEIKDVPFQEDWQLSQFWYDEETSVVLAKEAVRVVGSSDHVALVSCPTLYTFIKKINPDCHVTLLEYDTRFAVYGSNYIYYDYKSPLNLPQHFANHFTLVIADPPFLSEECLSKVAQTVQFLSKDKILLCTGSIMEDLAMQLLRLKKSKFEPHHQNNLANEFSCFSNYDLDSYLTENLKVPTSHSQT